jgi:hypothetical protein
MPRRAVAVWAVIFLLIGLRVAFWPRANGVYPIFSAAGRHWQSQQPVYVPPTPELDVFRYSPPAAAFFSLWSRLPDIPAGLLWRGLNAGIFFSGLAVWCRQNRPTLSLSAATLIVIPLAVGGLNNGQCNALVAGLLLLANVAFQRKRLTAAAALIAITVLIKGYPLAYGLLLCLIKPRRFTPRLAVYLSLGAALPYLFQPADYVTEQYANYFRRLDMADRAEYALDAGWRDLHMLFRRIGVAMDLNGYRLLEVELGLACAAVTLLVRYGLRQPEAAARVAFALAMCWMTVAGPATESSTYVLMSPVLALAVLTFAGRPAWQRGLAMSSFALFCLAAASVWFPGRIAHPIQATGIQPIAACCLTAWVIAEGWRVTSRRILVDKASREDDVIAIRMHSTR